MTHKPSKPGQTDVFLVCDRSLLANVNSRLRSLYVVVRPSVCRLSVTFVHPIQAIEIFGNVSMLFGTLAIQVKFYGDRPGGTPRRGS